MEHYSPEGMPRHLDYVSAAVPEVLLGAADRWPDRIAIADGEETLTYSELLSAARSVAAELAGAGLGPGDVIALHMPNALHYLTAYYGALLTGAAVTPVNPLQPASALARQLDDTGAKAIVTHPAHLSPVLEVADELGLVRILVLPGSWAGSATEEQLAAAEQAIDGERIRNLVDVLATPADDFEAVLAAPDDVAHYAFTGGTTGRSKGVRVLHRNVLGNLTQVAAWRLHSRLVRSDRGLLALEQIDTLGPSRIRVGESASIQVPPLFHAQGLNTCGMFIMGGVTIVLAGRFRPETFAELADRWNASYISGNPPMYHAISNHCRQTGRTLDTITLAVSGAAPLDTAGLERIAACMPNALVAEGYGLTEATIMLTSGPMQAESLRKLGTVGVPVPDVEIRIVDVVTGEDVPQGGEGELWARGPQITDGYHNAPEQTAAQYVDGWLRTGDVASVDEDGFVRIHDRSKDMLIYKGYNVYPRELEEIGGGHPDVSQIAVIGRPDDANGELPLAFVVPVDGADFDAEAFLAFVAERVLPYQKIREVVVVDSLPTSAAGKILKTELRRAISDAPADSAPQEK